MPLPLERDQIQQLTEELEVIIAAHLAWFKQLNRAWCVAPICPRPTSTPRPTCARPSACGTTPASRTPLAEYAIFQELGAIQQAMHAAARLALLEVAEDGVLRPTSMTSA